MKKISHNNIPNENEPVMLCFFAPQKSTAGFSTLELLIAFAVLTLSLTAVILVAFGNQSVAIDTELAQRALYLAEKNLEEAGALAISDFDALGDTNSVVNLYSTKLTVSDDLCFKEVTSEVFWQRSLRNLSTALTSIFSSPKASEDVGGDCPNSPLSGDWDNPISFDISNVIQNGSSGTDVDVLNHPKGIFAILTSEKHAAANTLWVIDVTDPENPDDIGGFAADYDYTSIDAYVDSNTGFIYAFVASASTTAQLQVLKIDLSSYPVNPPIVSRIGDFDLPGVTGSCPYYCPEGRTISYRSGSVYIGTHRTGRHEFHVYTEFAPGQLTWSMSKEINHNVNDFMIAGDWAYLATSDNEGEVIALNIGGFSIPYFDDNRFDAPGSADGTSIYATNQKIYLGRERSASDDDFFILSSADIRDTATNNDGTIDSQDFDETLCIDEDTLVYKKCLKANTAIESITINSGLAFLATTQQTAEFQVWDVKDNVISPHVGCNAYEFPAKPVAIDFPGALTYSISGIPETRELSFVAVDSQDALRIIYDQDTPSLCI